MNNDDPVTEPHDPAASKGGADREPLQVDLDGTSLTQALLARAERNAALQALAGRLAHQIRNPLAAVRAACNNLKSEIEDTDQRETLDLAVQEIDRMLRCVEATVQTTVSERIKKAQPTDVEAETAEVVDIARSGIADDTAITLVRSESLLCALPRDDLRVAIYSMLDHLTGVSSVDSIQVEVSHEEDRALIAFEVNGGRSGDRMPTNDMTSAMGWVQPVGLLVAERFAREFGGYLLRSDTGGSSQTFTLNIPCGRV